MKINIFYRGNPIEQVLEYSEVELSLTNSDDRALSELSPPVFSLFVGQSVIRDKIKLSPGGTFAFPWRVSDLVGNLVFAVKHNHSGRTIAQANLTVIPQRLSLDDVSWIKTERLPNLLARLDAPNQIHLFYDDNDAEQPRLFNFVSADYTAIKLRHFCQILLDELAEPLLARLDFQLDEAERHEPGFIRSGVRWEATVKGWANRPAETGLVHTWLENPRRYDTLPNRLLLFLAQELRAECSRLVELVQQGAPASSRLIAALPEFEDYASALENLPEQTNLLRPLVTSLQNDNFHPKEYSPSEIAKECESTGNPAYIRLAALWQEYLRRYAAQAEDAPLWVGFQPMSKVFELWAACEIANALGLAVSGDFSLESAIFTGVGMKLHYNRAAPGGWYSASEAGRKMPPRPDLRLELADGSQVLLDVKYRRVAGAGDISQANPEDVYRMLAYMNDLGVRQGGIIFPGEDNMPGLRIIEQKDAKQQIAELALRPPHSGEPAALEEWNNSLKNNLHKFLEY